MILTTSSPPQIPISGMVERRRDMQYLPPPVKSDDREEVLSLRQYVWVLSKHWWKILLFVAASTGLATYFAYHLTPQYESTTRIAIDLKSPSTVIGDATEGGTSGGEADQYFNTELQMVQSDAVLRPVAEAFHLRTASPRHMPSGMNLADLPVSLPHLTVLHPANSFLIDITYRSPDPRQAAAVANAVAHSYIQTGMEMRAHASMEQSAFMEQQMGELKKNMDDSETALVAYEKQLGVIDPDEKTSILSARLLQLSTQFTEAQSERERKEVDYRALQAGSPAAIEVSPQATELAKMEEVVHEAQEKMAAAKTVYGPGYPEYKRAANSLAEVTRQYAAMQAEIGNRIQVEYQEAGKREKMLHDSLLEAKGESDALNAQSVQYQELKREAEANKNLYNELFRKVKEAGINAAFLGSAMRIADEARPQATPAFPSKIIFIALGFFFSLAIAVIAALLSNMFDNTLRDPEQVRRDMGVEVLGILPQVRQFQALSPGNVLSLSGNTGLKKSNWRGFASAEFYEEAIATLLSTILISRRGYPLRSILVTSAAPNEGKSSCLAHMALAYSRQGFRTLLIDADLRRPFQQRYFGLADHAGLADSILNDKSLADIRQHVAGHERLDVITAGSGESAAYGQVGRKVQELLVQVREEYDLVFIDSPPMLGFNEPIQLASVADGVLVISHAGETNGQEVAMVLSTLRRLRANTVGLVLNRVHRNMSSGYRPYQAYYRHRYASSVD